MYQYYTNNTNNTAEISNYKIVCYVSELRNFTCYVNELQNVTCYVSELRNAVQAPDDESGST